MKKDYDDLEKDADKVADLCNQLCDDVDKLEVISDKYNRALLFFQTAGKTQLPKRLIVSKDQAAGKVPA